jgi:transcriptional regulator with XRE-family HTH domain
LQPLNAEKVKEWRHRRMLSQQEVADSAGTSLFTIQRIERGEGNVRPKTGRGLAAALGVPIEELLPNAQAPLFRELPEQDPSEERRVIRQSAASLMKFIEEMKGLKELREAEMEDLGKGVGLRDALLNQMDLADKGLYDLMKELGVLDFAEAVKAGREMAEPEAIPLCHELLRRLRELEELSAEARVASGVADASAHVEGVKGISEIERQMQEGTLERQGTES